jgi:hypothetical protein
MRLRGSSMNIRFTATLLVLVLSGTSFGQDAPSYQCTYADMQRRVEVLYETGMTLPCEVHYYKDTEAPGEMQVLWRAVSEVGYCELKAQEFIVKLTELGWSCAQGDDAAKDGDPAPVDVPEESIEPVQEDDTLT